jgi:hypothetical protein
MRYAARSHICDQVSNAFSNHSILRSYLGVSVCDILLHAEEHLLGLVLSIPHVPELLEVLFDGLLGVRAPVARRRALLASPLELDLGI